MKIIPLWVITTVQDPFLWVKGGLIFLLGPINLQLAYLLLALGIDLIFGIQIAIRDKTFKWNILFKKLRHKIIIYSLWISMFHAFDMVTGLPDSARWAVIVLLAGLEMVSAIKNTARLGHNQLADALERLYLALTKSNISAPTPPVSGAEVQVSIPVVPATVPSPAPPPGVSLGDVIGATYPGVAIAEGGSENEPVK